MNHAPLAIVLALAAMTPTVAAGALPVPPPPPLLGYGIGRLSAPGCGNLLTQVTLHALPDGTWAANLAYASMLMLGGSGCGLRQGAVFLYMGPWDPMTGGCLQPDFCLLDPTNYPTGVYQAVIALGADTFRGPMNILFV